MLIPPQVAEVARHVASGQNVPVNLLEAVWRRVVHETDGRSLCRNTVTFADRHSFFRTST